MPLVTVFNLRAGDDLPAIEAAITRTLSSMPELAINDWEIDVVPVMRLEGSTTEATRINVELWEREERTRSGCKPSRLASPTASAMLRAPNDPSKW